MRPQTELKQRSEAVGQARKRRGEFKMPTQKWEARSQAGRSGGGEKSQAELGFSVCTFW